MELPGREELVAVLQRSPCEAALEPLYFEAFESPPDEETRLLAASALASLRFGQMRLEEAAKFYRIRVGAAHDAASDSWLCGAVNLAQVLRLLGNVHEALVLARRCETEAEAAGHAHALAAARLHVAGILSDLDDGDRLEVALARLQEVLDAHPELPAILRALRHGYHARMHELRGEFEAGCARFRESIDSFAEIPGGGPYADESRVGLAGMLVLAGRVDEAAAAMAEAERSELDRVDFLLNRGFIRVAIQLETAGAAACKEAAQELLEELWAVWKQAGSGTILRFASQLGRFVADRLEDPGLAGHAFDLAARAALQRVVEIGRALRELPAIARPTPEEDAIFAGHRERFAREHGELLTVVAHYLGERAVSAVDLVAPDGSIALCPWCKRVRTEEGLWLPVAAYLPGETQFDVAHLPCGECGSAAAPPAL